MDLIQGNLNYYNKDGKAYTEDHICVYKIRLLNLPNYAKYAQVARHFRRFGEMVKVKLVSARRHNRQGFKKSAVIHFADARVAARVLKYAYHADLYRNMEIVACDSWLQPYAFKPDIDSDEIAGPVGAAADADPTQRNILTLHDDCLMAIVEKLDLLGRVRLARTCRRFCGLVQMNLKIKPTFLISEYTYMTRWEVREVLQLYGRVVETVIGAKSSVVCDHIMHEVSLNCPNAKVLIFDDCQLETTSLRKLLSSGFLQKATTLQLDDCWVEDSDVPSFKLLSKLRTLTLARNYMLTGKHLSDLTNLHQLDMRGCDFETPYFIAVIQSLKDLQTLDITECRQLSPSAFNEMETYCHKLEVLRMSCHIISYDCIARLPALKQLDLSGQSVSSHLESLFTSLVQYKSSQLESLKITADDCISPESARYIAQLSKLKQLKFGSNRDLNGECLRILCELEHLEEIALGLCEAITNADLLNLVRSCTKLRLVSVQCPKIDNQFVYDVIELLRERQPPEPVVFMMKKTAIDELILNSPECLNTASLLTMSFHYPSEVGDSSSEASEESYVRSEYSSGSYLEDLVDFLR